MSWHNSLTAEGGNQVVLIKSLSDKSTKLSALLPSRHERMNAIVVVFVYIQNYSVIDFAISEDSFAVVVSFS